VSVKKAAFNLLDANDAVTRSCCYRPTYLTHLTCVSVCIWKAIFRSVWKRVQVKDS